MSFTSYEFILAVAVVFVLYYTIPKRFQWMFLLGESYVLYFTAGPSYLIFISITTAVTFFAARKISSLSQEKTAYLKENKATLDREAKKAYKLDEVPIGCVIVQGDKIIARGYNRRNTDKNTLAHAELAAIKKASKKTGDWRLEDCTMYVTLEPCQMCAGAIVQARITETVMGCMNPKAGCGGSLLNILEMPEFNHQVKVTRGVMAQECSDILKVFFKYFFG